MDNVLIAVLIAVVLSHLICIIELMSRSKVGLRACITNAAILYLVIVIVGNTTTTLAAPAIVGKLFTDTIKSTTMNELTMPEESSSNQNQSTEESACRSA